MSQVTIHCSSVPRLKLVLQYIWSKTRWESIAYPKEHLRPSMKYWKSRTKASGKLRHFFVGDAKCPSVQVKSIPKGACKRMISPVLAAWSVIQQKQDHQLACHSQWHLIFERIRSKVSFNVGCHNGVHATFTTLGNNWNCRRLRVSPCKAASAVCIVSALTGVRCSWIVHYNCSHCGSMYVICKL